MISESCTSSSVFLYHYQSDYYTSLTRNMQIDETLINDIAERKREQGAENKVLVAVAVEYEERKLGRCHI